MLRIRGSIFLGLIIIGSSPSFAQSKTEGKRSLTNQFFHPSPALNAQVEAVYESMSAKERAAQMIMTASSTAAQLGYPYAQARQLVQQQAAANVVFLKGDPKAFKQQADELNRTNKGKLKPLFACDCEPSLLPGKWSGTPAIQPASAQKTEAAVISNTKKINDIMKQTGVQLNFAPVVDISVNKSVINNRSFGNNSEDIIKLSKQFVTTSQEAGIAATLKHFPGHGAVSGDSHKQSVYIDGELTELNTFKSIIQSSTPPIAVMLGHIVIKNNEKYDTKGLPASLSPEIVKGLLRKNLGFKGIITTDALNMVAASKVADADWKAVLAGVDLVLMPSDAKKLNNKIMAALEKNDALSTQLKTSIKKIILLKLLTS